MQNGRRLGGHARAENEHVVADLLDGGGDEVGKVAGEIRVKNLNGGDAVCRSHRPRAAPRIKICRHAVDRGHQHV